MLERIRALVVVAAIGFIVYLTVNIISQIRRSYTFVSAAYKDISLSEVTKVQSIAKFRISCDITAYIIPLVATILVLVLALYLINTQIKKDQKI